MTRRPIAQRVAERLINRACRRLAGDTGHERYREWAAELPAILGDPDVRAGVRRAGRALGYAAGLYFSTRRQHRTATAAAAEVRQPALFPRPDGVLLAIAAVVAWLTVLALARSVSPGSSWIAAFAFLPDVLFVVALVRFIRWYRRRSRQTPRP